jgi:hypothetical protein
MQRTSLIDSGKEALQVLQLLDPSTPPWSRVGGKSEVNLPQMPPLRGGICMGVDYRNHPFAPGLPPGRFPAALEGSTPYSTVVRRYFTSKKIRTSSTCPATLECSEANQRSTPPHSRSGARMYTSPLRIPGSHRLRLLYCSS